MVGASNADFARVEPLLKGMGTTIYHCGDVGTGTRTKLVNNYLAIASCQLNAEALALSQRFGLDLKKTLDVLYGTTAFNGQLKIGWPVKVLKGDIAPGFTIDLAHKDFTLILKPPTPPRSRCRSALRCAKHSAPRGRAVSAAMIFPRWLTYYANSPASRSPALPIDRQRRSSKERRTL